MIFRFSREQTDRLFFTADQHFGHENIIKFCERPFASVGEMDMAMVDRWNNIVGPDDTVFHLGDFTLGGPFEALCNFLELNGRISILANHWHHDKRWLPGFGLSEYKSKSGYPVQILPPEVSIEIESGGEFPSPTIHLSHYPIGDWDRKHYGGWHLHGHSHGKYKGDNHLTGDFCWDVGVDGAGVHYAPVSFGAILEWAYECNWNG